MAFTPCQEAFTPSLRHTTPNMKLKFIVVSTEKQIRLTFRVFVGLGFTTVSCWFTRTMATGTHLLISVAQNPSFFFLVSIKKQSNPDTMYTFEVPPCSRMWTIYKTHSKPPKFRLKEPGTTSASSLLECRESSTRNGGSLQCAMLRTTQKPLSLHVNYSFVHQFIAKTHLMHLLIFFFSIWNHVPFFIFSRQIMRDVKITCCYVRSKADVIQWSRVINVISHANAGPR